MNADRKAALIAGVLFILAALTAIAALALYGPVLNDSGYIIKGPGPVMDAQVETGALLELVLAFSVIGISITVYPILKRFSESLAIGYVCARVLEAVIIITGIISVLSVLTLSHAFPTSVESSASAYLATGRALVALHDWTFLFGPDFSLAPGTLIMAFLLYRWRLVPRFIAVLGLAGAVAIFAAAVMVLFGAFSQTSAPAVIMALPVFAYEMTFAVWLIAKGFRMPEAATGAPQQAARGTGPVSP